MILLSARDLGQNDLQGDRFVRFRVESLEDLARPTRSQVFDDLVPAGKNRPGTEPVRRLGADQGFGFAGILILPEPEAATNAMKGAVDVLRMAKRTLHRFLAPARRWLQPISR